MTRPARQLSFCLLCSPSSGLSFPTGLLGFLKLQLLSSADLSTAFLLTKKFFPVASSPHGILQGISTFPCW